MILFEFIGIILFISILAFAVFIIYSTITRYNPPKELILGKNAQPEIIQIESEISILSWNIGYAGLGDNMDFFFDGGKKARDDRERTVDNLDSINQYLKKNLSYSFILIQEVDIHSKRSYYFNQWETLICQTKFYSNFAPNYVVKFVPIPLYSPMGQVNSGIMNLSKFVPESSTRFSFPGKLGWPNRLYHLRRCMLVNRYPTINRKEFVLINTHMSLLNNGSLKIREMQFLKDFVIEEYTKGNYVVVGGDWNQLPPKFYLNKFSARYHRESAILRAFGSVLFPIDWKWAFDPELPTNRDMKEPYIPGKTIECLIDYYLVSPNIEVLQNETFDLNFRNSDHNPISIKIKLKCN